MALVANKPVKRNKPLIHAAAWDKKQLVK